MCRVLSGSESVVVRVGDSSRGWNHVEDILQRNAARGVDAVIF